MQSVNMNLRIIKAGIQDSIQDTGRYHYQHLGINPGGAMDKLAAQTANLLVGNELNDAVIEIHFPASSFFFEQPALIAISGADFTAAVNGEEIPMYHPVLLSKFSILQFLKIKKGSRAYLSVMGGFNIQPWLGSFSSNLKAGCGGFKGRALQQDDEISIDLLPDVRSVLAGREFVVLPWNAVPLNKDADDEILILPGSEWDVPDKKAQADFLQEPFYVSPRSDRMGYLLDGTRLSSGVGNLVSSAVDFGTIQLLPNGQLIILMADHQTAGGYPKIAHVITAHHTKLAQLKPGDPLHFRFTSVENAEQLLIKQQQHLLQQQNACKFKLENLFASL